MKQWMQKLIDQFDFDWNSATQQATEQLDINEDRATLLYIIDAYNKHLIEMDKQPVRRVRETLDEFARELVKPGNHNPSRVLYRIRQFFSAYRLDEYTYLQKTFDEFRSIIWDFVDQIGEEIHFEKNNDQDLHQHLESLREAVEANSIEALKSKSREFIDSYVSHQTLKDERRAQRIESIKRNLSVVQTKLAEANKNMRLDPLTGAFNRRSFDEKMHQHLRLMQITSQPVSLLMLDIDHFKKINDTFGHPVGDFVLQELVKILNQIFHRDQDFVARVGGEEFAIILPDYQLAHSEKKAKEALQRIQQEVFIQDGAELRFTISIGIAQLAEGEGGEEWLKRADAALYASKNNGRNQFTSAKPPRVLTQVA